MIDLEKLDSLPKRESITDSLIRRCKSLWNVDKWDNSYRYKEYPYWKLAKRIINNNIGKSFDDAFSKYCSEVPKHKQYIFLEDFFDAKYGPNYNDYIIDKQGNIQESNFHHYRNRRYKITYYVCSPDYDWSWVNNERIIISGWVKYFDYPTSEYYKLKREQDHLKKVRNKELKKLKIEEAEYALRNHKKINKSE